MKSGDILGALRWAAVATNPATRGRRVVAFAVAVFGRSNFEGASSIGMVAAATNTPLATLYRLLVELEDRFGLIEPGRGPMVRTVRENIDHVSDEDADGCAPLDEESENADALLRRR